MWMFWVYGFVCADCSHLGCCDNIGNLYNWPGGILHRAQTVTQTLIQLNPVMMTSNYKTSRLLRRLICGPK